MEKDLLASVSVNVNVYEEYHPPYKRLTYQGDMSDLARMSSDLSCTVNFLLKLKDKITTNFNV